MRTPLNGVKKERVSITIDSGLLEKLRIHAEQDDRSLSQYINRVLKRSVSEADDDNDD